MIISLCFLICIMFMMTLFIIISKNPIYAVLNFIGVIIRLSIRLISLKITEFLGLIPIIIYAGAIAVLFSFVVMMLQVRFIEISIRFSGYFPMGILLTCLFFYEFIILFNNENLSLLFIYNTNYFNFLYYNDFINSFFLFEMLHNLGFSFYNYSAYELLAISILLLIAMIGSISLTSKMQILIKTQDIFSQLERNLNTKTRGEVE